MRSPGEIVAVIATVTAALAFAWSITRAQALTAWRSAAEGYKEQVNELTGRLSRAEGEVTDLNEKVASLELRPDMAAAIAAANAAAEKTSAEIVRALRDALDPIRVDLAALAATLRGQA